MAAWYLFYRLDGTHEIVNALSSQLAWDLTTLGGVDKVVCQPFDHRPSLLEVLITIRFGPMKAAEDAKTELVRSYRKQFHKSAAIRARRAFKEVFGRQLKPAESIVTYEIHQLAEEML